MNVNDSSSAFIIRTIKIIFEEKRSNSEFSIIGYVPYSRNIFSIIEDFDRNSSIQRFKSQILVRKLPIFSSQGKLFALKIPLNKLKSEHLY